MKTVLVICILLMMPIFVMVYLKANKSDGQKAAKLYKVSILALVIASVCYLVLYFFPFKSLALPWESYGVSLAIGILIGIISYGVGISAQRELKKSGKQQLVTSGIFSRLRHPWAFNEVTCFFMLAFFANSGVLVVISFLWIPVFVWVCKNEETQLIAKFGQAYISYKNNSGFIFPVFRKLKTLP